MLYLKRNNEYLRVSFIKQEDGNFWLRVWKDKKMILNTTVKFTDIKVYQDLNELINKELYL